MFITRNLLLAVIPTLLSQTAAPIAAQAPCQVDSPTATFTVPYFRTALELNTDPQSKTWKHSASAWMVKDCAQTLDYPDLKTEIKGFWTDTHVYLLFICPYRTLNLFLPAQNGKDRDKLWDRDVVETFLGDRKSTRLNSSHIQKSRMPSSA